MKLYICLDIELKASGACIFPWLKMLPPARCCLPTARRRIKLVFTLHTAQRAAAARNLFDIHLAGALQRREVRRGGGSWGVVDGGKAGGLALHAAQRSGRMPNLRKT